MDSFKIFLENQIPVWKNVSREKAGFIDNSGKFTFGDNHYDLAKTLGMSSSTDLITSGVRVTLGHKMPSTTEIGFELMANNSKGLLNVIKFILDF